MWALDIHESFSSSDWNQSVLTLIHYKSPRKWNNQTLNYNIPVLAKAQLREFLWSSVGRCVITENWAVTKSWLLPLSLFVMRKNDTWIYDGQLTFLDKNAKIFLMVARSVIFYWLSIIRVNMTMCQIIDRTFLHTLSQNDFLELIFACTFPVLIRFRFSPAFSCSAPSKMTKMIQRGLTVNKTTTTTTTRRTSWFRLFRSWILNSTTFFKS